LHVVRSVGLRRVLVFRTVSHSCASRRVVQDVIVDGDPHNARLLSVVHVGRLSLCVHVSLRPDSRYLSSLFGVRFVDGEGKVILGAATLKINLLYV